MRRWAKAVSGTLGALMLLSGAAAYAAGKTGSPGRWAAAELDEEGDVRVVVTYREGLAAEAERPASRIARKQRGRVRHAFSKLPGGVVKVRPENLAEALAELEDDADVTKAEPDRKSQRILQSVPWGISAIAADPGSRAALSAGAGVGVKVAVIDTGIWRSPSTGKIHPDLAAVYKGGYDFVNDDSAPWDDNGHGTHVAGIVAAANNRIGVVGAAPGVALYALKTLDKFGAGWESDFIAALDWSIKRGITVVNYSAGGYIPSAAIASACARARAAGITIVAAAGNDDIEGILYPAAYDSVIAVGGVDQALQRVTLASSSWGSNWGPELDLVAPGEDILSTFRNAPADYLLLSGTSMAAPHVAGVAALLAGRGVSYPDLVQDVLEDTAQDLGAVGRDSFYGAGLVDAGAVLPAAPAAIDAPLAGEVVPSGAAAYPLQWEPVAGAAAYRLLFSRGASARFEQLASGVGGTSFSWNAPVVGKSLTSARFQVAAYNGAGRLIGVNTRSFAVQAVAITTPLSGQDIAGGTVLDFAWSRYATLRRVYRVGVEFSKNHGVSWRRVKTLPGSAASWQWRSPVVTSPRVDWRFRIVLLDRSGKTIGSDAVSLNLLP